VDVDTTEEFAYSWPDPEIEGWRFYRIEYGGCNEDCYYEGRVILPPQAYIDHKFFEILQVPDACKKLHEAIDKIHKEEVGELSNWEEHKPNE
jgi:hypothetical protein